jgi:hypothetical protein
MLNIITLLVYISFINAIYIGGLNPYFKKETRSLLAMASTANITNAIPNPKPIRSKYCNFKCDCFFSHSVKNDNICVPVWIRPLGL